MANMKKITYELKSFFALEISASAVNVITSLNHTMNRKFNQLNNRLNKTLGLMRLRHYQKTKYTD